MIKCVQPIFSLKNIFRLLSIFRILQKLHMLTQYYWSNSLKVIVMRRPLVAPLRNQDQSPTSRKIHKTVISFEKLE